MNRGVRILYGMSTEYGVRSIYDATYARASGPSREVETYNFVKTANRDPRYMTPVVY